MTDEMMTPDEVAKYLNVKVCTIYNCLGNGTIPGFKVGSKWRISKDLLFLWIKHPLVTIPTNKKNLLQDIKKFKDEYELKFELEEK